MAALRELDSRLRALDATRRKLERLLVTGSIARRDLERVYEGLYMAAITAFEDFLESLFFELMLDDASRSTDVVPRAEFRSAKVLRDFVLNGRPYVNWLPYRRTEARAKIYLRSARPFDAVSLSDKRQMSDWMVIRHAIAHTSREARRRFESQILSGTPLPPRERTPAGYLRSNPRQGVSRFENITRQMLAIGQKLR